MAFFTLEDRMAEIECVAFARQYAEHAHLIRVDAALFVSGTVSLREDEPPKILINKLEALVEDARFTPEMVASATPTAQERVPVQSASARSPKPAQSAASARSAAPRRLFLRVPSRKDAKYLKALNLCELFEGEFPSFFYFADEKSYDTAPHGVAMSDYVMRQMTDLLGAENVILQ